MSPADEIRAEAAVLRKQAAALEAIAARLDGQIDAPLAFRGDDRAQTVALAICTELGVPLASILSPRRSADIVAVRDIIAHAFRHLLGLRLHAVSLALGRLDHAATSLALRRVRERRTVDRQFAALLERGMKTAHATLAKLEGIENDTQATEPLLARVG